MTSAVGPEASRAGTSWLPASGLPLPAPGLLLRHGLQFPSPHAQTLALDVHLRPVAVEGDDEALGVQAPDPRPVPDLDRARDFLLGLARHGDDRLGLGREGRRFDDPRGRHLGQARCFGARARELPLDAARELAPRPLKALEAFGEHPCPVLGELSAVGLEALVILRHPFALAADLGLCRPQALDRLLGLDLGALAPLPGIAEDLDRALEHGLGEALLPRDGEGVAAAGQSRVQPVVRAPRPVVELHCRAQRVGARRREALDGREVRRDERPSAAVDERLEQRDRDGASLLGIGRAADLVDERERVRPGLREDRGQALHGRGERGAVRQDRLGVADLRADRAEYRQARPDGRGNRDAALREHREEAGRLQHDGLAAGVGPRNDEQAPIGRELEIEGDGIAPLA